MSTAGNAKAKRQIVNRQIFFVLQEPVNLHTMCCSHGGVSKATNMDASRRLFLTGFFGHSGLSVFWSGSGHTQGSRPASRKIFRIAFRRTLPSRHGKGWFASRQGL